MEDLLTEHGVRLDDAALGVRQRPALLEDSVGNADLADVVEQEAVLESRIIEELRGVDLRELQRRTRWEWAPMPKSLASSAFASAVTVSSYAD